MEGISFDQLVADPEAGIRYKVVETSNGPIRLGSLTSEYIIEWFEENNDPKRNALGKMRLVVRSIINPDGKRVGEDVDPEARDIVIEKAAKALAKRDAADNGKLVRAALELNYLEAKVSAVLKNGKGERASDDSRTDSPSPSVEATPAPSSAN